MYPQDDLSLDNPNITGLYKLVYDTIDFSAIREPVSSSLASKMNIEFTESFDCMPLYIKQHYKPHGNKDSKTLLIAGSAAWLHLNILSNESGNIEEFEKGLSQFISYLNIMSEKGYKLQFLYGAKEYPAKDDREFMAFIEKRLSRSWTVLTATSLDEWLAHIENAALLVSGRFHHSIAAACLGTPFIALNSNTPKIDGMLVSLGCSKIFNYNDADLSSRLLDFTSNLQKEQGNITSLEELCNKAMNNFSGLKALITRQSVNSDPVDSPKRTWQQYLASSKDSSSKQIQSKL
jgi:polysaccharide pyruvyl transferase WcaK-like protein